MIHLIPNDDAIAEAAPRPPAWFTVQPLSLVIACAYAVCLLAIPIARGDVLANDVIMRSSASFAVAFLTAMLSAWLFWRLARRSNKVANGVFCLVIVASAMWTTGLSGPQRAQAEAAISPIVDPVLDTARDLLE